MISGHISHGSKGTFEMVRPFAWKETPYVISSWESVISSLCEDLCILSQDYSTLWRPSQPLPHLLCIMSNYCQSGRPARGARSRLGPPAAAEPGSLPFFWSICLPWCRVDRPPASQPCGSSCQALQRARPTPFDIVVLGCTQPLSKGKKQP